MNLAQLRALLAVADEGTFTGAGDALGLTQSAVSHAVASLERELELPLVVRGRGGAQLTAYGRQILAHAREAVHRVDRIASDAAAATGQHRGRLRVAVFPSAAQLLPKLIYELGQQMPDVTVVLLEGTDTEVRAWLADRIVDLAAVADLADPVALDAACSSAGGVLLAADRIVAVLDPDHPLARQPQVDLHELADDPLLLSDGGCEPLLRQLYDAASLPLRPARRIRDVATLLAMVRERLGVTVVPELTLPDGHGLAVVPIIPPKHRRLFLVPADDKLPAAATALLSLARRQRFASRTSQ